MAARTASVKTSASAKTVTARKATSAKDSKSAVEAVAVVPAGWVSISELHAQISSVLSKAGISNAITREHPSIASTGDKPDAVKLKKNGRWYINPDADQVKKWKAVQAEKDVVKKKQDDQAASFEAMRERLEKSEDNLRSERKYADSLNKQVEELKNQLAEAQAEIKLLTKVINGELKLG